jgi:hypothetical protein
MSQPDKTLMQELGELLNLASLNPAWEALLRDILDRHSSSVIVEFTREEAQWVQWVLDGDTSAGRHDDGDAELNAGASAKFRAARERVE